MASGGKPARQRSKKRDYYDDYERSEDPSLEGFWGTILFIEASAALFLEKEAFFRMLQRRGQGDDKLLNKISREKFL